MNAATQSIEKVITHNWERPYLIALIVALVIAILMATTFKPTPQPKE